MGVIPITFKFLVFLIQTVNYSGSHKCLGHFQFLEHQYTYIFVCHFECFQCDTIWTKPLTIKLERHYFPNSHVLLAIPFQQYCVL